MLHLLNIDPKSLTNNTYNSFVFIYSKFTKRSLKRLCSESIELRSCWIINHSWEKWWIFFIQSQDACLVKALPWTLVFRGRLESPDIWFLLIYFYGSHSSTRLYCLPKNLIKTRNNFSLFCPYVRTSSNWDFVPWKHMSIVWQF